jgi:hypothetical protein
MRKLLSCLFISVYVYTVTLWLCAPSEMRNVLLQPVRPTFNFLGLWQEFAVFGPNPRKTNLHLTANITTTDGKVYEYVFPRIEQQNHFEKLFGERIRKYGIEHLNWNSNYYLWPHFCAFLVRLQEEKGIHPAKIELMRHWAYTPPPEQGIGKPPLPHSNHNLFYTYYVPAKTPLAARK